MDETIYRKGVDIKLMNLAAVSPRKERIAARFAKELLLNGGGYFHNGNRYTIKSKSVGAGVYDVWAEVVE